MNMHVAGAVLLPKVNAENDADALSEMIALATEGGLVAVFPLEAREVVNAGMFVFLYNESNIRPFLYMLGP